MLFGFSLLSLALLPLSIAAPLDGRRAPIRRSSNPDARSAPNSYIISIKANTVNPTNRGGWLTKVLANANMTMSAEHNATLHLGWNEKLMNGIAGTFTDDILDVLRSQDEVESVEPDYLMSIFETVKQQDDAPWGISRLSTGQISLKGKDPIALQYPYFADSTSGAGTDVYVLDTGVLTTHDEFEGRATFLASFGPGVAGQDVNGHGTHVSGTIAGKTVGVAKKANIFMIKVFADDGSGTISDIISGINTALNRVLANPGIAAVVNMSLGGPRSTALDAAVSAAIAQGLPFCVAAGNDSVDADATSPAHLSQVITVGATDINDNIASFSNFGNAVDVFAPGVTITSASFQGNDQGAILSGTSMATPHVTGLVALIMGQSPLIISTADLSTRIKSLAVNGIIGGLPSGTTNTFAFNGGASAAEVQQALAA